MLEVQARSGQGDFKGGKNTAVEALLNRYCSWDTMPCNLVSQDLCSCMQGQLDVCLLI